MKRGNFIELPFFIDLSYLYYMARRGRKSQVVYLCAMTLEEFSKYDCCLVQPIDVLPNHYTVLSKSYWNEYKPSKRFKLIKWEL